MWLVETDHVGPGIAGVTPNLSHGPATVIVLESSHRKERRAMSKVHRSAISGRFVTPGAAARHPKTTISQSIPSHGRGNRSAITGRYVTYSTAARHPKTTVREGK